MSQRVNALGLVVLRSFWINLKLSIYFWLPRFYAASSYALRVAVFHYLNASNFLHPLLYVPLRHTDKHVLPLIEPLCAEIFLGLLHKFVFTLLSLQKGLQLGIKELLPCLRRYRPFGVCLGTIKILRGFKGFKVLSF